MISRFAKNGSLLLRRMSVHKSQVFGNNYAFISNISTPLRSVSNIFSNRLNRQLSNTLPLLQSKRFAANSPQSDKELSEFLVSEIELEKKSQKKSLPSLTGWSVSTDGSNVTLKKSLNNEEITLKTNVNHSVDAENADEEEVEEQRDKPSGEMVCRPDFAVEIKRKNTILGINCSFVSNEDVGEHQEEFDDMEDEFQINEISIFEGEFKENSYAVSGDVMDGSMYDLIMDLLQERGIDQDFARKLVEYTTVYEHTQYVGLLEKLKDFISQK